MKRDGTNISRDKSWGGALDLPSRLSAPCRMITIMSCLGVITPDRICVLTESYNLIRISTSRRTKTTVSWLQRVESLSPVERNKKEEIDKRESREAATAEEPLDVCCVLRKS
jgi:hypothetical protein